jgi:mannosyltransferase
MLDNGAPVRSEKVTGRSKAWNAWGLRARLSAIALPSRATHPLPWLLLLALVVRLINLTYHSLWFDEAMSTFWAARPAAYIWRVGLSLAEDRHPPVYYLLLRGWTLLFGTDDFAVRSMGVLIGALAVLPAYGIGRRLGGRRAALLGALLLALNPFLVWYSQEARMFMPATTFVLVGLYGVVRLADSPRWWGALLIVLGFVAALYSYLYSAFILPVAGAWLLLMWWRDRDQGRAPAASFWPGVAALAVVGLLFLPLARAAWLVSGAESTPGRAFAGLLPGLGDLLKAYAVGWPHWNPAWTIAAVVGAAALALAGWLLPSRERGNRLGGAFLAAWLLVVILVGGLLLSRDRRIFAETRYQIALVPALCLSWGRALSGLWGWRRLAGVVATALVLATTLAALPYDWTVENRRENWREAAAFVQARAGPNDAILIQTDYVRIAFLRYYRGRQKIFYPFTEKLDDPARVDVPLTGLAGFDAVWVVQSHQQELDPGNLVLSWFAARYPLITEVYPTGIAIHAYAQHYRTKTLPVGTPALEAPTMVGPLRLLSCGYGPASLSAADDALHPPSGWVHVTTHWAADDAGLSADIFPVVRLVDRLGQIWGDSLTRGGDSFHLWPTSRWLPNEILRADHDVNLNPITPDGVYQVVVEAPGLAGKTVCGEVEITH